MNSITSLTTRVQAKRQRVGGIGVVGFASVVPPLAGAAIAFGTLQIVWFAWLGVTMLRTRAIAVATAPSTAPTAELVAR